MKKSENGGRGRGRQQPRATIECYKCKKLGHYKNECPEWDKEANYVENDDYEEMLLMAIEEVKEKQNKSDWFLESGCSNHMCGEKA